MHAVLAVVSVLALQAPSAADPAPAAAEEDAAAAPRGDETETLVDAFFEGAWLDPPGEFWEPRRGARWEVGAFVGSEAPFLDLGLDDLPDFGGVSVTLLGRYYPVDRLGTIFGVRSYLGLDGAPAPGTGATTVVSGLAGARYDLVRENRFSLLWDVYSGPALFVVSDLADEATTALGIEAGTALSLRYTLGPWTGEARGVVGGRAGASATPFPEGEEGGPFSLLYAGGELGLTWSL